MKNKLVLAAVAMTLLAGPSAALGPCPETTPVTIICTGTAGQMMKLVLQNRVGFAETISIVQTVPGNAVTEPFMVDGIIYVVYDGVGLGQGYAPGDPLFAVAKE